jgi:transposase
LLDLFELVPTPASLKYLKRPKVEALLKRRRIRRIDADTVLTVLHRKALPVAPGVAEAASEHACMIVAVLKATLAQREHADRRIEEVLAELEPAPADEDAPPRTRDVDIVLSLPGVGPVLAATLLAEATSALLQRDYETLRTRSGVAPVTNQTGKQKPMILMRRACHHRLRTAVHIWSGVAIQHDDRLRALYARLRRAGASHGRALRSVGDRSLAMLVSMLKSNTAYDRSPRASAAGSVASDAPAQVGR